MQSPDSRVWRLRLLPTPLTDQASRRAALALARALGLSPGEARAAMAAAPLTLPRALSADELPGLEQALGAYGLKLERLQALQTSSRCASHPARPGDSACLRCGGRLCSLCALGRGGLCAACGLRALRLERFTRARIGVLAAVALGLLGFAVAERQRRAQRNSWSRTVDVAVVVVTRAPPPDGVPDTLARGLAALERRLAAEFFRYRSGPVPFHLRGYGPVRVSSVPPLPEPGAALADRGRRALELHTFLSGVRKAAHLEAPYDVLLVVELEPGGPEVVEGAGEAGGDFGLVRVPSGELDSALSLTALGHELLHCFGATDKYDEKGHARIPEGLAEPDRVPLLPQAYVELMVGERPLEGGATRVPEALDEVRVGPLTAREVGWSKVLDRGAAARK